MGGKRAMTIGNRRAKADLHLSSFRTSLVYMRNTISSEEIILVSLHYRGFDSRYFAVIPSSNVNTQTMDMQDNA